MKIVSRENFIIGKIYRDLDSEGYTKLKFCGINNDEDLVFKYAGGTNSYIDEPDGLILFNKGTITYLFYTNDNLFKFGK